MRAGPFGCCAREFGRFRVVDDPDEVAESVGEFDHPSCPDPSRLAEQRYPFSNPADAHERCEEEYSDDHATDGVCDAYGRRAEECIVRLGGIEMAAEPDRALVGAWASEVRGRFIEIGCGPGRRTNYLRDAGADVEGVDPVLGFINDAR